MPRPRRSTAKTPELRALGEAVRQLRVKRGWSQEELADRAGIPDASRIGRTETGQVNATYLSLWQLARAFEISLEELAKKIEENLDRD